MIGRAALLLPLLAGAASGGSAPLLFRCTLGAKHATVTAVGKTLVYQYGSAKRVELRIVGSAAAGNLFYRTARYAAVERQLRFTAGRYSYIVFSVGGSPQVGASADSGLSVLDGTRHVADDSCHPWSELKTGAIEGWHLPEDGERFSAM